MAGCMQQAHAMRWRRTLIWLTAALWGLSEAHIASPDWTFRICMDPAWQPTAMHVSPRMNAHDRRAASASLRERICLRSVNAAHGAAVPVILVWLSGTRDSTPMICFVISLCMQWQRRSCYCLRALDKVSQKI